MIVEAENGIGEPCKIPTVTVFTPHFAFEGWSIRPIILHTRTWWVIIKIIAKSNKFIA